ncbi:hypothetical protein DPMN_152672 [Dreissena polymorpha]|uniref:Uncharacterized protein n=1 Tax=Dreissena polymorpha TaxID=45954 RepID=A0A9D4J7J7_DREPO|nr:hypothetical protein DPMN_152672 [Dreissena polymorpha]
MYYLNGIYVFPHKTEGKSTSLRRESVPPPNMQDHWLLGQASSNSPTNISSCLPHSRSGMD